MNLSAFLGMMATLWLCGRCETAPEVASNAYRRFHNRPVYHGYPFKELLNEDKDIMELNKRQQFDDYGHMRFGKRDQFDDDYGHMRFGRGHE